MVAPPQAPPVKRPTLVEPHRLIEVDHGDAHQLLRARLYLLHGANHNDPAPFELGPVARMAASTCSSAWVGPALSRGAVGPRA